MIQVPTVLAQAATNQNLPYNALFWGWTAFIAVLLGINYGTRSGIIARATTKEAVRQPVFILFLIAGIALMGLNIFVPFFSMGDDTKMYIDCGLATVLISSLLVAVWTASISVAEEIEGKTAITLLAKPINRRQFVWGKYVGIMQTAVMMIFIMGIFFFFLTYYKTHYDRLEASRQQEPLWYMWHVGGLPIRLPFLNRNYYDEARLVFPGLTLIAMEAAVMTAVSVAISTRVPMMVNISTCFAVFVIGHLTPVLVLAPNQNVFVKFVGQMVATVLPSLEWFNLSDVVSTGKDIPPDYLGWAALYCAAYVFFMILAGFWMFEDRDLA